MAEYTATLVEKKEINEGLGIFKFKLSQNMEFKPGQWLTLAHNENNKRILRPYSIASSPSEVPQIELFVKLINKDGKPGAFTAQLFKAEKNQTYEVVKIGGIFILDENDSRKKILIGSGTGLAPYISMIRNYIEKHPKGNFIVIHGVSYENDLAYKDELKKYEKENKIIKYIPTISRPDENPNWKGEVGRVEDLIKTRLKKILGEKLDPKKHVFYLCGHPNMIETIEEFLKSLGFKDKEDIKFEKYWSTPKLKLDIKNQ